MQHGGRPRPPLGAHLSIAGGPWKAVERAVELGCEALQIFTQAPGRWSGPALTGEAAERFRAAARAADLEGRCFAHVPYLVNVASGDAGLRKRSAALLADQLERARLLGLAGVVLHPGAHGGDGVEVGLARAAETLAGVLEAARPGPLLLLETTAGQGTVLGSVADELGSLLGRLPRDRVGVCWDTAHLWAAGYDLATEDGWQALWEEFVSGTGEAVPRLVHLNDTAVERGSRRDRHERIGYGVLGEAVFRRIVTDGRLGEVPMVLETPKGPPGGDWDREALELLRRLRCDP